MKVLAIIVLFFNVITFIYKVIEDKTFSVDMGLSIIFFVLYLIN